MEEDQFLNASSGYGKMKQKRDPANDFFEYEKNIPSWLTKRSVEGKETGMVVILVQYNLIV